MAALCVFPTVYVCSSDSSVVDSAFLQQKNPFQIHTNTQTLPLGKHFVHASKVNFHFIKRVKTHISKLIESYYLFSKFLFMVTTELGINKFPN